VSGVHTGWGFIILQIVFAYFSDLKIDDKLDEQLGNAEEASVTTTRLLFVYSHTNLEFSMRMMRCISVISDRFQ
jgi:hypothetical protein